MSAELRWFMPGPLPPEVTAWFDALDGPVHERTPRADRYLRPTDERLGVKLREGRVEFKRRAGPADAVSLHLLVEGRVEVWRKWSFGLAAGPDVTHSGDWIRVAKRRRMRHYRIEGADVQPHAGDPLPSGGDMELTTVDVGGTPWWTLCLEANTVEPAPPEPASAVLRRLAAHIMAQGTPPELPAEAAAGYPGWLLAHGL